MFPEPPSATLSQHAKRLRDDNLRARVMGLREEIRGFDLTDFEKVSVMPPLRSGHEDVLYYCMYVPDCVPTD